MAGAFTAEAVEQVLLDAGFTRYVMGLSGTEGFTVAGGRGSARGEILVQHRTGRLYKQPGDDEKRMRHEEAYEAALAGAGYRAHIDMQYVVVVTEAGRT